MARSVLALVDAPEALRAALPPLRRRTPGSAARAGVRGRGGGGVRPAAPAGQLPPADPRGGRLPRAGRDARPPRLHRARAPDQRPRLHRRSAGDRAGAGRRGPPRGREAGSLRRRHARERRVRGGAGRQPHAGPRQRAGRPAADLRHRNRGAAGVAGRLRPAVRAARDAGRPRRRRRRRRRRRPQLSRRGGRPPDPCQEERPDDHAPADPAPVRASSSTSPSPRPSSASGRRCAIRRSSPSGSAGTTTSWPRRSTALPGPARSRSSPAAGWTWAATCSSSRSPGAGRGSGWCGPSRRPATPGTASTTTSTRAGGRSWRSSRSGSRRSTASTARFRHAGRSTWPATASRPTGRP